MSIRMLCAASVFALVAGCAQVDDPAQSPSFVAASLGYDAYKSGDLATAETRFEEALSAEPDNPYALLGLGAVRENTGDLDGARRLYSAASGTGTEAQANYTYITEQRLERAANVDVAALANENLERLAVKQAALAAPASTGFASYDDADGLAPVPASYTQEVAPAFAATDYQPGSDYQPVGSYDSYVASAGGTGLSYSEPVYAEPAYSAPAFAEPAYAEPVYTAPVAEAFPAQPYIAESYAQTDVIGAVDYGPLPDTYVEPAAYREDAPYYAEAPVFAYSPSAAPVPVTQSYAPVAPSYGPAPVLGGGFAPTPAGPAGRVVGYGTPIGDGPIDLVAPSASPVRETGGLVFLD